MAPAPSSSPICAKFRCVVGGDGIAEIPLSLGQTVTIGRHVDCDYVLTDPRVSQFHCTLSAVASHNGGILVSCRDFSRNGLRINEHPISRTVAIIMHGDRLHLSAATAFACHYLWHHTREKTHLFQSTPPPPGTRARKITIDGFVVTSHQLGVGAFASVYLAYPVSGSPKRQLACKVLLKSTDPNPNAARRKDLALCQEVMRMRDLEHPNLNRIYALTQDDKYLFIFLALCAGGDLFDYICSFTQTGSLMPEEEAKFVTFQLLIGMLFLHDKQIAHRDLKPDNILLYAPGPYPHVVIADFGLARPKAKEGTPTVCGTLAYLPPEAITVLNQHQPVYTGMPSDCWSLGVTIFILLCGYHPFDHALPMASSRTQEAAVGSREGSDHELRAQSRLKARILNSDVEYAPHPWDTLPTARELVSRLLMRDYRERATMADALVCPWIEDDWDALEFRYNKTVLPHKATVLRLAED